MSLPWHARHHQDALDGMLMLTLEERGAYNTVLDLIYSRAGPVPDDERWLSGWMGCSVKKWRLLRAALLVKGKIFQTEHGEQPALMNGRADQELQSASTRRRVAAESGARGGRKTAETKTKTNEINDDAQATLVGSLKLLTETVTVTEEDPPKPNGLVPPKSDKATGSRLPENWFPMPFEIDGGAFLPADDWAVELDKFRDYWRGVPGAKGRKLDWDATWRNWLRRASENLQTRKANGSSNTPAAKRTAREANHARAFHGSLRAAGLIGKP